MIICSVFTSTVVLGAIQCSTEEIVLKFYRILTETKSATQFFKIYIFEIKYVFLRVCIWYV